MDLAESQCRLSPELLKQRPERLQARAGGADAFSSGELALENLAHFLQNVPRVMEVSIGHALIGDALEFGLAETVRKYLSELPTLS